MLAEAEEPVFISSNSNPHSQFAGKFQTCSEDGECGAHPNPQDLSREEGLVILWPRKPPASCKKGDAGSHTILDPKNNKCFHLFRAGSC